MSIGGYPKGNPPCDVPGSAICPVCGAQFRRLPESIYKHRLHGLTYLMCSYKCYNIFKKEHGCRT